MRPKRYVAPAASKEHKLEMTPMIDVTFLLLIFFMCTLKFRTLEGKLETYLPNDVGVHMHSADPLEPIDIRLDVVEPGQKLRRLADRTLVPFTARDASEGRCFVYGEDRVVRYGVGPYSTTNADEALQHLEGLVSATRGRDGKPKKVTVDPRVLVIQDEVVEVVDGLMHLGIEEISFKRSLER